MAGRRLTAVFTENFSRNLDAAQAFLGDEGQEAWARLLDHLFEEVIPTLAQFPRSGRVFLGQPVGSVEANRAIRRLRRELHPDDELREFILDDYLVLYLIREPIVVFLAIKHHRQLSFDLHRFWP